MSRKSIPRDKENDYTDAAAQARRDFVEQETGVDMAHTGQYSSPTELVSGNCENFVGMSQIPVGLAGPVLINGQYAQGEFLVPLATTEGTLVASYNRGMRAISESGGVTTTVFDDYMQRAPAFKFQSAREVQAFMQWFDENYAEIKSIAESTSSVAKLEFVQRWPLHNTLYMRWNYSTGDAAGQNMVSKATHHAAGWIQKNFPGEIVAYSFSGGMDTDKKHSSLNNLYSRGKRVIAEVTLKKEVLEKLMRTTAVDVQNMRDITSQGALLAGATYTGGHSANGIAAFFIATGQDEANVVESHAGQTFTKALDNGDLYWSWTLPSIIVATFGGGTGLATQNECLRMMDCVGKGKARKLAEITAAVVVAGDVSIANAIVAGEFVESHEKYGRNR
ncbi:MAG: hydroxymethylglutaryl-CoA reductase [Gammaproteobacteria bacterium]|nr:hydroxymethylglutaryl-CoA reductase [Gammaproteobacteria bacterium]